MALIDDLVSYWKLDEASGTRVDSHGSNDLTDTNTVGSATGIINLGADFESSSSEYLIDSSPSGVPTGNSARSISMWLKFESLPASETVFVPFVYGTDTPNDKWEVWVYNNSGTYRLGVDANGALQTSNGVSISTATWYYLCITYDGTTLRYYWNNSSAGTDTPTSYTTASSIIRFSGRPSNDSYFDGLIDEAGFWSRALTTDEITELYNGGAGLAYPFSSPANTTNFFHLM